MNIDVDRFLAPVSDEDVAGPDLAYDPERFAIEQAFESGPDEDGSSAPTPDWPATIRLIEAQAGRTKDLWLAVYLCRAAAHAGKLDLVATGAEILAGLLETMWDDVHPQLDEYGFQGRKGVCDTLATYRSFIEPLAGLRLLDHPRLGAITAADLVRFHHGGADEEGYGLFRALLDDDEAAPAQLADALARIAALRQALTRVDAALTSNAGGETGTNFAPVYEQLGATQTAIRAFLPAELRGEETIEETAPNGGALPPMLAGREDVVRALELVIDYYRRREPSSPIPLLLERAKGWVQLDFVAILNDIAPRAIDDVRLVLQARSER